MNAADEMKKYATVSSFLEKGKVVAFGMRDVTQRGRQATSWQFDLLEDESVTPQVTIHLSDTARSLVAKDRITEKFLLCKRFVQWYRAPNMAVTEIEINRDNYREVTPSPSGEKELVRRNVLKVIHGFWEEGCKSIDSLQIQLSCDFNLEDVEKARNWLQTRGWVRRLSTNRYQVNPEYVKEIEEFLRSSDRSELAHRYFQEVPIDVEGPFVFVIMPFREEEFPQRIYEEVIKPLVWDEFRMPCLTVNEDYLGLNTLNKIYTYIRKCDFLIAETSTRNPNVFYELGMAHTLGKDAIIIENESTLPQGKETKYIFDTDKYRCNRYTDDNELRDKLRKVVFAHTRASKRG